MIELFKERLSLMYAKYKSELHILQVYISLVKVLIDYFHPDLVVWDEAFNTLFQIINELNVEELINRSIFYGTKVKRRKLHYNTKNDTLVNEIYKLLSNKVKKTDICNQLNLIYKTLYNIIHNDKNLILVPFRTKR